MMNFRISFPKLGLTFLTALTEVVFILVFWKFVLNSGEENFAFSHRSPLEL